MKLRIKKHSPGIILCEFEDLLEMTNTFVRIEEFYENPVFAGKYFTLNEFMEKYDYKDEKGNPIDYFTYWEGFNVTGECLNRFKSLFKDLSIKEYELFDKLSKFDLKDAYVIAYQGDEETLLHELAHAYYYTDKFYKSLVDMVIINSGDSLEYIADKLKGQGYDSLHLIDELNAHLATDRPYLKERYNCDCEPCKDIYEILEYLFFLKHKILIVGINHAYYPTV